ncbi:MAG: OmpA family protein [Spirochaetes bacterium]|nr:OmpA family protein [Spirochaetota bacterium]
MKIKKDNKSFMIKNLFKVKNLFLIIVFLLVHVDSLLSEIFKFNFKKDDIIQIYSITKQNIYVDEKLAKVWNVESLSKLFVKDFDEVKKVALINGKYSFYEVDDTNKTLFDMQEVEFYQKENGEMVFSKESLYPTLRNAPVFPQIDIEKGYSWWFLGEEIQDFKNFAEGFSSLIVKIPIFVCYTFEGDKIKDGKIYKLINAKYDMSYPFQKENLLSYYLKTGKNVPQYFGGNVSVYYYWDIEKGYAPYFEQVYDLYLIMADGTRYRFSGTSSGGMEIIRKWDDNKKNEIINQIKKDLPPNFKDIELRNEKKGIVIDLGEILFDYNSDKIKPDQLEKLIIIGNIIKKYFPSYQVIVEGHTDDIGSDSYNLDLSRRRAYAVYSALIKMGFVNPNLISYIGYGKQFPKVPNTSEENRKKNRRVQIVIVDY